VRLTRGYRQLLRFILRYAFFSIQAAALITMCTYGQWGGCFIGHVANGRYLIPRPHPLTCRPGSGTQQHPLCTSNPLQRTAVAYPSTAPQDQIDEFPLAWDRYLTPYARDLTAYICMLMRITQPASTILRITNIPALRQTTSLLPAGSDCPVTNSQQGCKRLTRASSQRMHLPRHSWILLSTWMERTTQHVHETPSSSMMRTPALCRYHACMPACSHICSTHGC
jgi:hypothetical protein